MKLVKENHGNIAQPGIVLEPAQKNAFGDKADTGSHINPIIKAHLVTDLSAKSAIALPSDPRRHRAGGNPPGLQDHNAPGISGQAGVQQHLRNLRCFSGTGRRDKHHGIMLTKRLDD